MKRMWHLTENRKACGSGFPCWGFLSALTLSMLIAGAGQARDTDTVPVPPPAAEPSSAEYDYSQQALRVGVWLDKDEDEVYRRGENLTVGLQTNGDAYAVVYRIDAEGLVTILWPRSRLDDGFVFGGHEYSLPVSGAPRLRVSGEAGLGYVEAIVSSYPFDLRDLEIDFHHENRSESYDFYVAGDPFLAMNEVNFAVTGLEDAADYVVTNYASYYVHEKVDHPRYLCNQCHFDDTVAYHPYQDHCTLEINYDFGWSNSWYGHYGYYPVYWHPTYVYIDPWTWRPWVNFWYYPSYVCPPYPYYAWGYSTYAWYDSPYYRGDSYVYLSSGYDRYRPLGRIPVGASLSKSRDYASISSRVKGRLLDDDQRVAMKTRTPVTRDGRRDAVSVKDGIRTSGGSPVQGERPIARTRPELGSGETDRVRPGLQVRGGSRDGSNVRPNIRHTAGGSKTRPALNPVAGKSPAVQGSRGGPGLQEERPVPRRNGDLKDGSRGHQGTIKPVEPRKKGTRVWNRGSYNSGGDRSKEGSGDSVRDSRSADPGRSGSQTVRPKPSGKDGGNRSKVSPEPRKSGNDSGRSPAKQGSTKVREDKGSSSSGSGSSGGSSQRSDGGSSGSSGGGSKRSGGDTRRR